MVGEDQATFKKEKPTTLTQNNKTHTWDLPATSKQKQGGPRKRCLGGKKTGFGICREEGTNKKIKKKKTRDWKSKVMRRTSLSLKRRKSEKLKMTVFNTNTRQPQGGRNGDAAKNPNVNKHNWSTKIIEELNT